MSRIWTGGGDYCSREHRNQHRLRLGMDRLVEANKVANLMRRRENLKPVSGLQPVEAAMLEMRSLADVKIIALSRPATTFRALRAMLRTVGSITSPSGWAAPAGKGFAGRADPIPFGADTVRMRLRSAMLGMLPRRVQSAVRLVQAPLTMPRNVFPPGMTNPRLVDMLRGVRRKPVLGKLRGRIAAPANTRFNQFCRTRPLPSAVVTGMDLRVSKSQGFRPPNLRLPPAARPLFGQSRLVWEPAPYNLASGGIEPVELEQSISALPLACREPRMPGPRKLVARGKDWPPSRTMKGTTGAEPAFDAVPGVVRVAQAPWNTEPPESSLRCEWYETMPRITTGYAEEPRSRAVAEGGKIAPALMRLQENFDNGCANWVGGIGDWRLDAAGARTGSLALYQPSLELIDYDMEFLVRVENRSATWVFRAMDTSNYYRAALRVTPEGGYEFTRSAVIDGLAEPAVSAAVAGSSKTRTALSVRTVVNGSSFAVHVDGKPVDQWTDSRLPSGGAGFGEAPDDRARLYWVRLTYLEGHATRI